MNDGANDSKGLMKLARVAECRIVHSTGRQARQEAVIVKRETDGLGRARVFCRLDVGRQWAIADAPCPSPCSSFHDKIV